MGRTEVFHIDVTVTNSAAEALTLVGLSPRIDADNIRFTGTSNEWININGGDTETVSVSTSLAGESDDVSFDWRFCFNYVTTESIHTQFNAPNPNVDSFMAKHLMEDCGASRLWSPDTMK